MGRTIALYSDSGGGKTTQIGEYAKFIFKSSGRRTILNAADLGGFSALNPLIKKGIILVNKYDPSVNDPWVWINQAVEAAASKEIGLHAFDSGTSMCEALLSSCAKLSAAGQDIGGRPAPKFVINKGSKDAIKIGSNVDSHYMTVQGFIKDAINRSTWIDTEAIPSDILWTFGLYRGESQTDQAIYGPQLAGKALTPLMPKWFLYTFPLVVDVTAGQSPKHRLLLQQQPDSMGMATYYANSRYPMGGTTPCPLAIEPASLPEAITCIENAAKEAEDNLDAELGL